MTEAERNAIIALVRTQLSGKLVRQGDTLVVQDQEGNGHWTLDALTAAARRRGISVGRSRLRRILLAEGVRWRGVRSWAQSTDPNFGQKDGCRRPLHPAARWGDGPLS